jgi:hypothetical protein
MRLSDQLSVRSVLVILVVLVLHIRTAVRCRLLLFYR